MHVHFCIFEVQSDFFSSESMSVFAISGNYFLKKITQYAIVLFTAVM